MHCDRPPEKSRPERPHGAWERASAPPPGLRHSNTGDSELMASDMAADFGHSWRGRTLQGANRASSLLVLAVVGSVNAPDITVQIS